MAAHDQRSTPTGLPNYGVLKCYLKDTKVGTGKKPHFHLHVSDKLWDFRVVLNIGSQPPDRLLYFLEADYKHNVCHELERIAWGFHPLQKKPGTLALDYVRKNLFDLNKLQPAEGRTPAGSAKPVENDTRFTGLREYLDFYFGVASAENATLYVWGNHWTHEGTDKYFDFAPSKGISSVHMNQGNTETWHNEDGPWQDGALFIHFPHRRRWIALFLVFESQSIHTDDVHGTAITADIKEEHTGMRIVAAIVQPRDPHGQRLLTLMNTSPSTVNLAGWSIADRLKNKQVLGDQEVTAGGVAVVTLNDNLVLPETGGILTLLDQKGMKIHGVSYVKQELRGPGWTLLFQH